MNKKILEIYTVFKMLYPKHYWLCGIEFHSRSNVMLGLKKFINHDYEDVLSHELNIRESNFVKNMQNYFQKKPSILDGVGYGCEGEEGYNFRVDGKNIGRFLLSGLGKFYFLLHKKDTKQEKEILKYLESLGYEAVSHKNGETALDIIGIFFMPYDAWVEKSKEVYKDLYIDDDYYHICEMNGPDYPKDKVKDFEIYCKEEYEGPFKVSHLLLGENFNWVMK